MNDACNIKPSLLFSILFVQNMVHIISNCNMTASFDPYFVDWIFLPNNQRSSVRVPIIPGYPILRIV